MIKFNYDIFFIILLFILIILYFQKYKSSVMMLETFENNFDVIYAKIYDTVFDNDKLYKNDIYNIIGKTILKQNNIKFLDAGCGVGRHYKYLNQSYPTIGVDIEPNFLKYAQIRNPTGKFINQNLIQSSIFKPEEFSHIICLLDSIYHNKLDDMNKILTNFYYWLQLNGYLCIHIFDRSKLDPGPREFTQYYKDKNGIKHGLTYFNHFTHDAYWKPIDKECINYVEKIVLEDGRNKIKNTKLYIPIDKTIIIKKINDNGFKLIDIIKTDDDIDMYIFKKMKYEPKMIKV